MIGDRDRSAPWLEGGAAVAAAALVALSVLFLATPSEDDRRAATGVRDRTAVAEKERARRSVGYGRVDAFEATVLTVVVVFSFGLAAVAGAVALRPRDGARPFAPDRPWVGLGMALGVLGPALLWPARDHPRGPYTDFPAAMGGLLLVAAGWTLVGAGLRPRGILRRGAFLALALYALLGLTWTYWGRIDQDTVDGKALAHPAGLASAAGQGLIWPLGAAEEYELFGYITFAN